MSIPDDLCEAIVDLCWKATPTGSTTDNDVSAYILPKGVVHRLIGAAQCAGIPASFRAPGAPTDRAEAIRLAAEEAAKRASLKALAQALQERPHIWDILGCPPPEDAS